MIPAYALVYFSQHVLGVFFHDAFNDRCEESSLVETSLEIGKSGRPHPYFSCFFRVVWKAFVSHPDSRSDPIGGSEPVSEARDRTGTLYLIFFFQSRTYTCGLWPTSYNKIKILYTYLSSPIYKYKTVLLHL